MLKFTVKLAPPLLTLALLFPSVGEASSSRGAKYAFRPASIPAGYVPTPMGLYVSSQCVITLTDNDQGANGSVEISDAGITQSDGSKKPITPCTLPRYNRDGSAYKPGTNLMDSSSGNHDLIISTIPGAETVQGTSPTTPLMPMELPSNIAGQTIYFTAAMTGEKDGWLQFLAFNAPGHEKTWVAGTAISDILGNVILQSPTLYSSSPAFNKIWYPFFELDENSPESYAYRGHVIYRNHITPMMKYDTPVLFTKNTVFSVQTFGVNSCDMLPAPGKIAGTFKISPVENSATLPLIVSTWTSGLCNIAASADSGMSNTDLNFNVTFDTAKVQKQRSAVITFTTN